MTELAARDVTVRDLCERLRADDSTRCIPVIVVTSSCDAGARRREARRRGCGAPQVSGSTNSVVGDGGLVASLVIAVAVSLARAHRQEVRLTVWGRYSA